MAAGEEFIKGTAREAFFAVAAKVSPGASYKENDQRIALMQAYAALEIADAIREATRARRGSVGAPSI